MPNLTDVKGIGPSKAELLEDNGYGTVGSLAEADRDELAEIKGVGSNRALEYIVEASNLIEEDEGTSNDSSEDESGEDFDLKPGEIGEELEEESSEDTYDVTLSFDTRLSFHTFHASVMRYHETIYSGNQPKADAMQSVLDEIDDFESVDLSLTEFELNTLHSAVKQRRTEYQGDNLIDHMDELYKVEEQIDEARREYLF